MSLSLLQGEKGDKGDRGPGVSTIAIIYAFNLMKFNEHELCSRKCTSNIYVYIFIAGAFS